MQSNNNSWVLILAHQAVSAESLRNNMLQKEEH